MGAPIAVAEATPGLYPRVLGAAWHSLPAALTRLHHGTTEVHATGVFEVRRGDSWLARAVGWLFRLPPAATEAIVVLRVTLHGAGERWWRSIGGVELVTEQFATPSGQLAERFGPVQLVFALDPAVDGFCFRQTAAALCLGPLRLPLPRLFAPRVSATVAAAPDDDRAQVAITMMLPLVGLLLRYAGHIRVEGSR